MQSAWSACPPDLLQQCLNAQLDYSDNAAAACVNKLWRDTFRCGDHAIDLTYSPLGPLPAVSYLQQFPHITFTLRRLALWQSQNSWLTPPAPLGHEHAAAAVWAGNFGQLPPACSNVTLVNHLPRADASHSLHTSTLAQPFSQLTNLRQLNLQYDVQADVPAEMLSAQTDLDSLQITGRLPVKFVHLVGSLQALPPSITRLQLSRCEDPHDDTAFHLGDLTRLRHLKDLDLRHCRASWPSVASKPEGMSMLTRLTLTGTMAFGSVLDNFLPLTTLQVLTLRNVNNIIFNVQGGLCLTDLLCQLSCLQELDVIGCRLISISVSGCSL